MELDTEQLTTLIKILDSDAFMSRRKRERLITPKHPVVGAAPETGAERRPAA
jgi:hypothetical protein